MAITKAEVYAKLKGLSMEDAKKSRRAFWLRYFDTGVMKTTKSRQVWANDKLKEDGF